MSELTPRQIQQFQKVEELLDFKRSLKEERETVAQAINARIELMREKAEAHGISLDDLEARVEAIKSDFDRLAIEAENCFREACSAASKEPVN